MGAIRFAGLAKSYGRTSLFDGLDLELPSDRLTVLCGPPRSGKSVLLKLLVGLERPDRGRILFGEEDVTQVPAAQRTIGYVPQSFALFPHMSVFDNVAYPLVLQKVGREEIAQRIGRVAEVLRITGLLQKSPSQLSGGEKQRVAIARGTLKDADIFVFDDPLVGLDFKLRESLMDDLKEMRARLAATFLYATSDPLEALTMADHLVVMDAGRIVEANEVETLYHEPQHLRAAELIGFPRCNVVPGRIEQGLCAVLGTQVAVAGEVPGDGAVAVAIRPEHLRFAGSAKGAKAGLGGIGKISLIENLGAECVLYLDHQSDRLVTTLASPDVAHLELGQDFSFAIEPRHLMIFERASGRRLGIGQEVVFA